MEREEEAKGRKEGRKGRGEEKVFNSLVWSRFADGMVGKFRMPFGDVFFFFPSPSCLLACSSVLLWYGMWCAGVW